MSFIAFSGCKDKMLLDETEVECIDIYTQVPVVNVWGKTVVGADVKLEATVNNLKPGSVIYWEEPNGFIRTGKELVLNDISLKDSGTYITYIVNGNCRSKSIITKINVDSITTKCSISKNNWIDVKGLSGFENLQYIHTFHNSMGQYYSISPYSSNSLPDINIVINSPTLKEGEYTLTYTKYVTDLPTVGNYASMRIGYLPNHLANYTNGILNIKSIGAGKYEITVCDEPVKRTSSNDTYLLKMKLLCD